MKRSDPDDLPKGAEAVISAPRSKGQGLNDCDHQDAVDLAIRFREFVAAQSYPCVGAKSALGRNQMTAFVGSSLTSSWDDVSIVRELVDFARDYAENRPMFRTFVAFFPETEPLSEEEFEKALWERVESLQAKDAWLGQKYDPAVSSDPTSPKFSLSFGGHSFFIVGMHPRASRPARQFEVPTLVFNLHDQFERLRAEGRYERLRSSILSRDEQFAGSVNPMLSRHGEASEARQYSGRIVGSDWECPWPGRDPDGSQ